MQRITDVMIAQQLNKTYRLLRESGVEQPVFYAGDASTRVTNKLMLGKTNLWPDAMAGYTKRDAFNALRVMAATLAAAAEARETREFINHG